MRHDLACLSLLRIFTYNHKISTMENNEISESIPIVLDGETWQIVHREKDDPEAVFFMDEQDSFTVCSPEQNSVFDVCYNVYHKRIMVSCSLDVAAKCLFTIKCALLRQLK